jgi:hypothetical protein
MSKKKRTIFIGVIPGIFEYGISVAEETEEACLKALKKRYRQWTKDESDTYGDMRDENGKQMTRFEKAMEYWGGRVQEVELGKAYYDDFG